VRRFRIPPLSITVDACSQPPQFPHATKFVSGLRIQIRRPVGISSPTASLRECRVFFGDRQGVEHAVYVKAANRYHAFGLALNELRRCPWANADQADTLRLELMNTRWRALNVTRTQFEAWIGAPEDALRRAIA
jgi:hypothetical protein